MRKKLIITSSLITLLLALFPVSLFAEEVPQDPASGYSYSEGVLLDSYFYQNYDLLPYIESTSDQYINTGIKGSSELEIELKLSDLDISTSGAKGIFSSWQTYNSNALGCFYSVSGEEFRLIFSNERYNYSYNIDPYVINTIKLDRNLAYIDNHLVNTFTSSSFSNNVDLLIFKIYEGFGSNVYGHFKLYSFSIYDHTLDQNNEEIGYVRYYYPAKAKSSGTIGLYDAVSKTFVTTLGIDPFESPTHDKVLHFQISDFIASGLIWIGDILDFAISEPMILFFLGVGLAGAMYRWTRRLVHF